MAEGYPDRTMPGGCRAPMLRMENGRSLRLRAAGPTMGASVLMARGTLLPAMPVGQGRMLADIGLRPIVPLKTGHLDEQASGDLMHGADTAETLERDVPTFFASMFSATLPLIGVSLGGVSAIRLAAARPDFPSGRAHPVASPA